MILLKSASEVRDMRRPGAIVGGAHRRVREAVRPGITTREVDHLVEAYIRHEGGKPAFKGYKGFPASICISVNQEVVHGIPGDRVLREGDIVGVDIGVQALGFYADAAQTLPVGEVSADAERLLRVTREALYAGIAQARPGRRVGDVSHAVQACVERNGFSVVRSLVGHGIGRSMHEEPQVPNYGQPHEGPELRPGMVLAIEPMVNAGGSDVEVLADEWTVVTRDGSLSAHFEHSVAITEDGPVILTNGAIEWAGSGM
jgi:methionyl aminopeptidase